MYQKDGAGLTRKYRCGNKERPMSTDNLTKMGVNKTYKVLLCKLDLRILLFIRRACNIKRPENKGFYYYY